MRIASSPPENLFLLNPEKAFLLEAKAESEQNQLNRRWALIIAAGCGLALVGIMLVVCLDSLGCDYSPGVNAGASRARPRDCNPNPEIFREAL
jgi:hypothetical protein